MTDPPFLPAGEVEEAARRLRGTVDRTPLLPFRWKGEDGRQVLHLKCESLQRTGSFKVRGALNFLASLPSEEVERGVITYSSGNHGRAVAYAASRHGIPAVVVMPRTAPAVKEEAVRRLGAEIVVEGTTSEERRLRALEIQKERGLAMVPPFDDARIMAGQGTVAREVLEDEPELGVFVVPIGGGGLAAGCGAFLRERRPGVRLVGVEPEGASSMTLSLEKGEPTTLGKIDTIADGLAPVRPGRLTFRHVQAQYDEVVTVSDGEIREAARTLLFESRIVVEYSGAAALAALLSGRITLDGRRGAAVVSGGNLDPSLFPGLLRSSVA